ncbi:MAG: TAXI family TRAP transporter solute-binding subunit [Oscillospiraceae bacterium]|nr:TAXI family TRAP transporter solute-binding subunit [Oscillospiraceae bacterium]
MASISGCGRDSLKFGTSGAGGVYGEIAMSLADKIQKDTDDMKFDVRVTAGSAANVRLLSQKYLDIAIAQADIIDNAYYGTGTFRKSYRDYAALTGLYTEACQIVVGAESDIKTVDDLEGKKISIGEAESGTEQNATQILETYGLNKSFVNEVNLNYSDACEKLKSGEIDAFFCTLAPGSAVIKDLASEYDIRLIELSDTAMQSLVETYGFYTEYTIPKGTYPNQNEDVNTIGVTAVLLANERLDKEQVKTIIEVLFRNQDEINAAVSADLKLDPETVAKGISIPFHEGALEYYKESGIDIP